MLNSFPREVFVSVQEPGEDEWLQCTEQPEDAVEDDGPTRIATYRLVEVNSLSKQVVSKKSRNTTL